MVVRRMEQAHYRRFRPAAKAARRTARDIARRWQLDGLADDLATAVGELVTNAVVHGQAPHGSRVVVTYHLENVVLRVEVRDFSTGNPNLRPTAEDDEHGRGLLTVATLTERWGVTPRVIGKCVWFEMSVLPVAPSTEPGEVS